MKMRLSWVLFAAGAGALGACGDDSTGTGGAGGEGGSASTGSSAATGSPSTTTGPGTGGEDPTSTSSTGGNGTGGEGTGGEGTGGEGTGGAAASPDDVITIAQSARTSFATLRSGDVVAWGANPYGILGVSESEDLGSEEPHRLDALDGLSIVQLAVTLQNVFVLLDDGTVMGWGSNIAGLLGTGDNGDADEHFEPVAIEGLNDVVSLASGSHAQHMCALKSDGTVWCWGRNLFLGAGQPQDFGGCGPDPDSYEPCVSTPTQVAGITGARSVHIGEDFSCYVRDSDGALLCWGSNLNEELGTSNEDDAICIPDQSSQRCRLEPTEVPGVTDPEQVQLTGMSGCVLRGGEVTCWGGNAYGGLGIDSEDPGPFGPGLVVGLSDVAELGHASAGTAVTASCVLRTDGSIACWGYNTYGTLGQSPGNLLYANAPVEVVGANDAAHLFHAVHTCVTRTDEADKLWCWGANGSGQSGQSPGSAGSVNEPTEYDPTP